MLLLWYSDNSCVFTSLTVIFYEEKYESGQFPPRGKARMGFDMKI